MQTSLFKTGGVRPSKSGDLRQLPLGEILFELVSSSSCRLSPSHFWKYHLIHSAPYFRHPACNVRLGLWHNRIVENQKEPWFRRYQQPNSKFHLTFLETCDGDLYSEKPLHLSSSYCPISLFSSLSKVAGRVILKKLEKLSEIHHRLSDFQRGFRQLAEYVTHMLTLPHSLDTRPCLAR